MECSVRAVIQEQAGVATTYVRLQDARRRNLGVPPNLPRRLRELRGFHAIARLCEPVCNLLSELYYMVESYYLAAERPALVSIYTCEKEIASYLGIILVYIYRVCRATSSAISNLSIASFSLLRGLELGSRAMVFKYGYFGHSVSITAATNNRGVLLVSSFDKGAINISFSRVTCQGLLQLTHISTGEAEMSVTSHSLGFNEGHSESRDFITCVSVDPMPGLGTTMIVAYSNGDVEVWKESVCVTDLREAFCEAVAQCRVPSYPFFCAFSPCGEIATLLTVDDMFMMEWTGSSLSAIKLVEGSSADFWAVTRTKVLAAEWLNAHEFLSLAENGQLWLSRRTEMGYWQRVTQYILVEHVPKDSGLTSWISRMHYDGHGHLFIKMFGSHQLLQLKWDRKAMPDLTAVEFPVKELGMKLSSATLERGASGKLMIADFALEPQSALIAVVVSDRSLVCVYNYTNMRFAHVVDPPKPHLKVGGLKFLGAAGGTQAFLAIKWVEISLEIFHEQEDFDIDHKVSHKKGGSSGRLTVVYSFSMGAPKPHGWQAQTLAEILSGAENVVTSHSKGLKSAGIRRSEPFAGEVIPRLSIFKPTFPDKLISGTKNTIMFEDAFSHRSQIFGKHFPKNDNRIFPLETAQRLPEPGEPLMSDSSRFARGDSARSRDADTRIYSMEEFTRRRRSGL